MPTFSLDALDLAALLCSKVCHDVISPVGAIINGLEVLEEEKDAEMRKFANDLIRKSAHTASAKLQFCRLAFGAAGSAGASIDTGDAEQVARNLLADDRLKFEWVGTRQLMPKNKVKLILNLCLIASACIPRGGLLRVVISGENDTTNVALEASGPNLRLANGVPALLAGEPETGNIDAHGIQAYYTGLVARACDMHVEIAVTPEKVSIDARPATMAAAA
ncbi:MAG: histidine phosphotransferase [Rhizobiales bacterium 62-17]|nr:histidine phosphotransferase [Hyphomicrobiales bacterium]OJY03091.1 MAG: histidine phosphotransferase [Rhizobiales bacterium 62-17]